MVGGNKKVAMLYIRKQFESMLKSCEAEMNLSVGLNNDDLFRWRICFQGPEDTSFEGGLYQTSLQFTEQFPLMPPKMVFITEMFHPNIYSSGEVCISILHPPFEDPMNPQQKIQEKWNAVLTIQAVIMSVTSMLVDPNLQSPANVDAAKMLRENPKEYHKKLRYLARKSMGDA